MTEQERLESSKEKNKVAGSSVIAAIFLTGFKFIVGITTGSLGILSEALHSALDLVAAIITMFAVRAADKPPDEDHNFGHGKMENYSAFVETLLLVITCIWILYEAVRRLITHDVHIEVTYWSFIVVITSIIIDISRSRALMKAARKHNSQALEADAIHFSTDIYSSSVVLFGLIATMLGYPQADVFAAMFVAGIVLYVSYQIGKRSFDALVDRAPSGVSEKVKEIINQFKEVKYFHDLRVRESGALKFIEVNIHVDKHLDVVTAHDISEEVERAVTAEIKNSKVIVHIEPDL